MKRLTSQLAKEAGLDYCWGMLKTGGRCPREHRLNGEVTLDGVIHLADKPANRTNTHAFLRLAAISIDPTVQDETAPWRRVYRLDVLMRGIARHLKVPYKSSSMDRAFVLAGVAGLSDDVWLRKQAFDWARRGPKP